MHRGAFQLTLEGSLYSMISEGHVTLKTAERTANQLLDSMDHGPSGYDFVESETTDENNASNKDRDKDVSPTPGGLLNSTGRSAAHLEVADQTEEQRRPEVNVTNAQSPAVDSKHDGNSKWAAPRAGGASDRVTSNSEGGSQNKMRATSTGFTSVTFDDDSNTRPTTEGEEALHPHDGRGAVGNLHGGREQFPLSLGPCLDQVLETHRRACTRYGNQVAELQGQNAALAARVAEASRLEGEATTETKLWEAKYCELEGRLAAVEKRSREELTAAEERGEKERLRGVEAAELLKVTLETATPTLLDMLTGFAPRDTEGFGVDLLRGLRIEPVLYVHILATKRMFQVCHPRAWSRTLRGTLITLYRNTWYERTELTTRGTDAWE